MYYSTFVDYSAVSVVGEVVGVLTSCIIINDTAFILHNRLKVPRSLV